MSGRQPSQAVEVGTTRERLVFIQGMRGLAVLAVVVFHTVPRGGEGVPLPLVTALGLGHAGVNFFFVISGFCMAWPVLERGRVRPLDTGEFLRRRVLRIAPPYVVAVVIVAALAAVIPTLGGRGWQGYLPLQFTYPAESPGLAGNLLTHLTFTHGFFPSYNRSLDGAFWSLATEWQFYLLVPLLVLTARRLGVKAVAVALVGVPVVYVGACYLVDPTWLGTSVGSDTILVHLLEFGAGAAVAWVVSSGAAFRGLPILAGVATVLAVLIDLFRPGVLGALGWAGAAGTLTLLLARHPLPRRVAESPWLVRLGGISYSLYLLHGSTFLALAVVAGRLGAGPGARMVILLTVGVPVAVGLATGLHRLVEKPAVRWAHRAGGLPERPLADGPGRARHILRRSRRFRSGAGDAV